MSNRINAGWPRLDLELEMVPTDYARQIMAEYLRPTWTADEAPIYVPTGRGLEARAYTVGNAYFDAATNDYVTLYQIEFRANEHDRRPELHRVVVWSADGWRFITDPDRLAQLLPTSRPGPPPPAPAPLSAREIKV